MSGWIGVDLDGTVAEYDHWRGETHIGEPIGAMAFRVRKWLAEGKEVRIFTARVGNAGAALNLDGTVRDTDAVKSVIQDWTEKHFGKRLTVTCEKDFGMIELWDDRCVQVEPNTGRRMDGK
jgi:hypothetical protein